MGTEKPSEDAFIRLCDRVRQAWPSSRWAHVPTLVAVSGGADSVALLRVLAAIHQQSQGRGPLLVAHFHHGLRGPAADSDAAFVQQLAAELGLQATIGQAADHHPAGDLPEDEASMRDMRYRFLGQQAHRHGARYVAMGHTQDDNVETLLHQLMRGSGPAGLTGIPMHRELVTDVVLMRPLLQIRRQVLTHVLRQLRQPWHEDATNQALHWKRNWIRHRLLPLMETQYPQATQRIANTIAQQAEVMAVIDQQAREWLENCVERTSGRLVVRYAVASDAVVIHAMRHLWDQQGWARGPMTEPHWRAVLAAIKGDRSDRFDLPGGISVSVGDGCVEFHR